MKKLSFLFAKVREPSGTQNVYGRDLKPTIWGERVRVLKAALTQGFTEKMQNVRIKEGSSDGHSERGAPVSPIGPWHHSWVTDVFCLVHKVKKDFLMNYDMQMSGDITFKSWFPAFIGKTKRSGNTYPTSSHGIMGLRLKRAEYITPSLPGSPHRHQMPAACYISPTVPHFLHPARFRLLGYLPAL